MIVPEVFANYFLQDGVKDNAIISSGIATSDPNVGARLTRGGKGIDLPFWNRLGGQHETLSDKTALTVNKITAGGDYAAVHARGIAYGANDLAKLLSGDDPMGAIAAMLSDDWNAEMQTILLSSLKGAFASALSAHVKDISTTAGADGIISNNALIDAIYLLGSKFNTLTGIAMHSSVMAKLAKLKLLDDIPRDASTQNPAFRTYLGRTIIVDDDLDGESITVGTDTKKAFPIYIFGQGAVAYNENPGLIKTETDRDILTGDDILASRRVFTMHPRGVKWTGTPAGEFATDAELATAANWKLVDDAKNVHIAKLVARID